ncbi:hypothetical protein Tco_0978786 [Tanacetum coccineum]|uniref:Uncharacterized protein n=1 Tax=Tanacetum coccineum TaxID=301880 RepID=A0ABQ5EP99_9ASTR
MKPLSSAGLSCQWIIPTRNPATQNPTKSIMTMLQEQFLLEDKTEARKKLIQMQSLNVSLPTTLKEKKIWKRKTGKTAELGSGADEGTGVAPGVPDAPDYDSEDEISWKSSDDDQDDDEQAEDDEDAGKNDINETTQDDEDDDEHDDDEKVQDADEHDVEKTVQEDDDEEQTESDDDGDDFVHPKLTTHDDEIIHEEDSDEDDSSISTSNDEDSDNEDEGTNVEGAKTGEEATFEEDQGNEAVKDTTTDLDGRDKVMTDVEDTHVTLTPVNPDGQQQSSQTNHSEALHSSISSTVESISSDIDAGTVDVAVQLKAIQSQLKDLEMEADDDEEPSAWKQSGGFQEKKQSGTQGPSRVVLMKTNDSTFDFSAFVLNRLNVQTLTPELLAGPTFELMKGTCKSLTELEYFCEEVYKATTEKLDWINPEGRQYPHDLRQPTGGVSAKVIYLSNGRTTAADYGHIKWIEDLVPNSMWSQIRQIRPLGNLALGQEATTVLCICNLKGISLGDYSRRDDDVLYKFKEGDFSQT